MKKILILLLACSIAHTTIAQKFMVGIKGGINYSTAPLGLKNAKSSLNHDQVDDASGATNILLGLKIGVDMKRFQVGLGFDYGKIGYSYDINFGTTYTFKYSVTEPFLLPYVFASFKSRLPRSFIYYGVNAGYINLRLNNGKYGMESNYLYLPQRFPGHPYGGGHTGIVFGAQVGYTLNIIKGLSASVETGVRYLPMDVAIVSYDINMGSYSYVSDKGMLTIPFTLGVNYTF